MLKSRQYDAKLADIWSAGVMLFTMLCCSYPFERKEDDDQDPRTQTKIMQRILKGESLSSDAYQDCRCSRNLERGLGTPRPPMHDPGKRPGTPLKAVWGTPKRVTDPHCHHLVPLRSACTAYVHRL